MSSFKLFDRRTCIVDCPDLEATQAATRLLCSYPDPRGLRFLTPTPFPEDKELGPLRQGRPGLSAFETSEGPNWGFYEYLAIARVTGIPREEILEVWTDLAKHMPSNGYVDPVLLVALWSAREAMRSRQRQDPHTHNPMWGGGRPL